MITVIEICVLTYFMTYVFLFMSSYGNATYVMALLVAGILSLRGMNTGKGYRQADRFDELNPLYSMGFMREKSKHCISERNFFLADDDLVYSWYNNDSSVFGSWYELG